MSYWRKTSEKRPKDQQEVIYLTNGTMVLGSYDAMTDMFIDDNGMVDINVKSWCPIPQYDLED